MGLPDLFSRWFESRGWTPRPHQLALIELAQQGKSALLIAPTGGGKTLAGFLPSLIELTERRRNGKDLAHKKGKGELHTLYISPLKALATDIRRNLEMPIAEMQLPVRAESRTGDTPQSRRLRQRERPPDLLMTTPESLALLLSYPDAAQFFASLRCVIIDELHSFATSQARPSPGALPGAAWRRWRRRRASSACRPRSPIRRRWPTSSPCEDEVEIVRGEPGAQPVVSIIDAHERAALGRPHGPPRDARRSTTSSASTRPRSCSSTRAPRPSSPSTGCGASTRTIWRSACITARWPSSSAARSRRRWRRASCAPWWRPRRSISASTGATSTW